MDNSPCAKEPALGEQTKSFTCQICHGRRASAVWLLKKKNGQHEVRTLCTPCWFIEIPQRSSVLEIIFLQSLLVPESHNETEECDRGLVPTGEATILRTTEEIPQLIGVFVEMRCPICGFMIDVSPRQVTSAKQSYPHPNKLYAQYEK